MKKISSTNANRSFSKILADAISGEATEITVRGKVVARIVPATGPEARSEGERKKRWNALMERLKSQPVLNLPRVTRDEMYD